MSPTGLPTRASFELHETPWADERSVSDRAAQPPITYAGSPFGSRNNSTASLASSSSSQPESMAAQKKAAVTPFTLNEFVDLGLKNHVSVSANAQSGVTQAAEKAVLTLKALVEIGESDAAKQVIRQSKMNPAAIQPVLDTVAGNARATTGQLSVAMDITRTFKIKASQSLTTRVSLEYMRRKKPDSKILQLRKAIPEEAKSLLDIVVNQTTSANDKMNRLLFLNDALGDPQEGPLSDLFVDASDEAINAVQLTLDKDQRSFNNAQKSKIANEQVKRSKKATTTGEISTTPLRPDEIARNNVGLMLQNMLRN